MPRINVEFTRREMAVRGWDQQRLALEADVDPATISRGMQGREVSQGTVEGIAGAFDRTPARPELAALVAG